MSKVQGIRAGKIAVEAGLDDAKLRRGLRAAEKRLKAFGASVRNIGASMARMGVMMGVPFAAAAKTFASFEQQMARVAGIVRETGATDADIEKLNKKAKELGASTVFSASQAAEALMAFATKGYTVGQMLNAVGPALNLAAVAQIEIGEAAGIAGTLMKGMAIEAEELTRVTDVLGKAFVSAGNTEIPELGNAFSKVGTSAKLVGMSLEETAAAIMIVSDAGIMGEEGGTGLAGVLMSLTDRAGPSGKALKKLGVEALDMWGNFRGLPAIVDDLNRKFAGMTGAQKFGELGKIFEAKRLRTAAVLLDRGGKELRDAEAKLAGSEGIGDRLAAVNLDTLTGSVKIVLSALEGLAIEVGAAVAPAFRKMADRIISVLNVASEFVAANRALVLLVAKVAGGLIAAGAALVGFGIAIKLVGVAAGLAGVAISLLTSPLALVIGLAVAAGASFLYFSETGNAAFTFVKGVAIDALKGIADALKAGDITLAARILWLSLQVVWQKGIVALNDLTYGFIDGFRQAFMDVQFWIANLFLNVVAHVERTIATLTGAVKKFVAQAQALVTGGDVAAVGAAIDAQTRANVGGINSRLDDQRAALSDQREFAGRNLGTVDGELQRLQGELTAALAEAAEKAAPSPADVAEEAAPKFPGLPEFSPGAIESGVGASAAKTDIAGSFSGAALRGLGVGDTAADRTAEATEETASLLAELNDRARQGRLVFEA
jgi:TP901 family phage tail tape measure protein